MKKPLIGFIGQGYVGKSYADNFEARGFGTIRYSLEPAYAANRDRIKECDVVFIAVPTPTVPEGSDISIVSGSLALLKPGAIAVVKSTILPGTTVFLQKKYPDLVVLHSPEFLTSSTARDDVDAPSRNVIGIPVGSDAYKAAARKVLDLLPQAPFELLCSSDESEFIKYATNTFYYEKTVYMNVLYDLAEELGVDWAKVKQTLAADPWVGPMHIEPLHKSGRGAGGHCLIKDYAAFKGLFEKRLPKAAGDLALLAEIERKNLELLRSTDKDADIVAKVYGGSR